MLSATLPPFQYRRPMPPDVLSVPSTTTNSPGPTWVQPVRSLPFQSCFASSARHGAEIASAATTSIERIGTLPSPRRGDLPSFYRDRISRVTEVAAPRERCRNCGAEFKDLVCEFCGLASPRADD